MKKISAHISYNEATKSQTATRNGIDNDPTYEQFKRMIQVAEECFEPLRVSHGKAIGISSFYRSPALNKAIGGSATSQHCANRGAAIDIDADIYNNGIDNTDVFNWLKDNVDFDQLIWEYENEDGTPRWVHISYVSEELNRQQILVASRVDGRTKYNTYEG